METNSLLKRVDEMVKDLTSTNSNNQKLIIIKVYSDIKEFIELVCNPNKKFHITSGHILKFRLKYNIRVKPEPIHLMTMLNELTDEILTGHEALRTVINFIYQNYEYEELILKIIDKKLGIRMGVAQINKAFPNLIATFNVALAEDLDKCPDAFNIGSWVISRKLDGIRIITILNPENKTIKCYSRLGNRLTSTQKIETVLEKCLLPLINEPMVLDGEGCIVEDGLENFTEAVSQYKKKNIPVSNPVYYVFDMLTLNEFNSQTSERKYNQRYSQLKQLIISNDIIQILRQIKYTEENFAKLQKHVESNGWEGLIVRKNTIYKGKRSKDILKVKKFKTGEFEVYDMEVGLYPILNKNTGLEEKKEVMTAVCIFYKGNTVKVGSGFSIKEREYYYKYPDKIIGQQISVQYFEEISNKNNDLSLRFPTFKALYGKSRDI